MSRANKAELSFPHLALQLTLAATLMVTIGGAICNWQSGKWLLVEAVAGSMAAITPLLMSGRMTVEIARRYDLLVAGMFFMDFRLSLLRGCVALILLLVAVEAVAAHTEAAVLWFGLIYAVLVVLGARWLACGKYTDKVI